MTLSVSVAAPQRQAAVPRTAALIPRRQLRWTIDAPVVTGHGWKAGLVILGAGRTQFAEDILNCDDVCVNGRWLAARKVAAHQK